MSAAHSHLKYGFNYCSMLKDSCVDHSPKMWSTVAGTWEMHGSWFNHPAGLDVQELYSGQGLQTQVGIAPLLA